MNPYNLDENALASLQEMRCPSTISDLKGTVICPKPRRVGIFPNMPTRSLRRKICQQGEGSDSKVGAEILDIIFKESYAEEQHANQEALSPPYFLGSPPVRAANPLIQDDQFGYAKNTPQPTFSISSSSSSPSLASASSPSSPWRKGGCVRTKFGIKSATVRVEGFDCHLHAVA
ncbi:hypothetical protein RIF29_19946 [Crotalaria pallida]|uniref:Uncharacterized protein n=1 Tax=Crotalaria pallida TaxID=3830 RepID=A0AAN9I702_CROPI